MTLGEKIRALAGSYATEEDRLQVLIHLTAELAEKVDELEGNVDPPPTPCQKYLRNLGGAWPRSCPTCGLGGTCKYGIRDKG